MCNRARLNGDPETIHERFGASWAEDVVRPNRDPVELVPKGKAYVIRTERERRALDVMSWDVLGGQAKWPMTNVRGEDQNSCAGHIRWGKAIKGLVGKLGEFTARHAGPAPGRGYLIRVELASGDLACGYVTSTGEMLEPEIVAFNKAQLRRDMAAALRLFGGATRLARPA